MRVFHFSEEPYPNAWAPDADSLRITLPNSECDPQTAADLYHRYLDEWQLADELGFDIMVNEHHDVGLKLSRFMRRQYGDAWPMLERLKNALDPNGIMNPGKVGFGGVK